MAVCDEDFAMPPRGGDGGRNGQHHDLRIRRRAIGVQHRARKLAADPGLGLGLG